MISKNNIFASGTTQYDNLSEQPGKSAYYVNTDNRYATVDAYKAEGVASAIDEKITSDCWEIKDGAFVFKSASKYVTI